MNVFATPGEVFDEVRDTVPMVSNWLAPALILILVGWIGSTIVLSQPAIKQQLTEITDNAIRQRIEKMHMPKEQAEKAMEMGEKWGAISTAIATYAGPPVMAFLSPFAWGLIVWLGGSKVYKGNFDYMKAVEMVGLSNMIGVLEAIVRTLLILVMGNLFAAPSLALLVKDFNPQNPMHSLLALVNVMTIWILAVRTIGLARLARVSIAKAAVWVVGIWAGYTGLFWGLGMIAQLIAKRAGGS
jgi:VIT1/CCC1 family predicted Fe2+/Mn2+ transporter